jgi:hypothetical protein
VSHKKFDAQDYVPRSDDAQMDLVQKLRLTFKEYGKISGRYDYANGNCHVMLKFESKEKVDEVMKLKYKDVKPFLDDEKTKPHPFSGQKYRLKRQFPTLRISLL